MLEEVFCFEIWIKQHQRNLRLDVEESRRKRPRRIIGDCVVVLLKFSMGILKPAGYPQKTCLLSPEETVKRCRCWRK